MKILVLGARGFLGRHVAEALRRAGHVVVAGARGAPGEGTSDIEHRALDFNQVRHAQEVVPVLRGIDVVINTVGIFRESRGQRFTQLHDIAPRAVFEACVQSGVRRVIQVSALGADAQAGSAYHLSKRAADDYLLSLKLDAVVVQPSLVYGPGGTSAALFGTHGQHAVGAGARSGPSAPAAYTYRRRHSSHRCPCRHRAVAGAPHRVGRPPGPVLAGIHVGLASGHGLATRPLCAGTGAGHRSAGPHR